MILIKQKMARCGSYRRLLYLVFLISFALTIQINNVTCEYENEDEPECRENCSFLPENEQLECQKKYLEFYSYKLIKSMFNFAKISVFAGLWASRYENADVKLFEETFLNNLNNYNNSEILGQMSFEMLNETAMKIYDQLKFLTRKQSEDEQISYASYPSLQCPTPCTYELVTWQTMFGISLGIFVLSLITISLYSIFLRRQYMSLKNRIKSIKYTATNH